MAVACRLGWACWMGCSLAGLAGAADIHVAVNGNDSWSGHVAQPDAQGTDGPKATLAAALEASRQEGTPQRRIVLGPGRHYVTQTVVLEARDAGLTVEGAGAGKTIVYGGRRITGWRQDGPQFWVAEVPEVQQGKWDFRALVVNDRLCPRARLPQSGRLEHETRFPVRWMSTAGGGWERKPTAEELTHLQYRAGDLPAGLSVRNAEVTVYHMWDESLVGLVAHDPATRTLTFARPAAHPAGAFGVNTYVVWNVREGMTEPGQWYLDRDAGRLFYWPATGEDMAQAMVVAPCVETLVDVAGQKQQPVGNVTLRALTLSATTNPCKPGGFGANEYRGAVQISRGESVRLADLEITAVAGYAVRDSGTRGLCVENCHLHHLGAGGCRAGEGDGRIENNSIHHVGLFYPSAVGVVGGGNEGSYVIRGNEVHHTSYSGMCIGGNGTIVEENLLHHCMQELHDGAAVYMGGGSGHIIRRNVARDIVEVGKGYGVSSYYLDEKCRDCLVERNLSIGVARPAHNHMTLNCTLRDNVFVYDGDMDLSFARSAGFRVTGNIFHLNGKLKVNDPDGITEWSGNQIVQSGDVRPAMAHDLPTVARSLRQTPRSHRATPMPKPPVIDGKLDGDEWPAGGLDLGELSDQRRARGAPLLAKLCADATNLYVGVVVVSMFPEERKLGHVWGEDEALELSVQGQRTDGQPVTYVLRGFANGAVDSLTVGGAAQAEAQSLAQAIGYAAAVDKQVWRCEWRIPLATLCFTPSDHAVLPLNVTVYRGETKQFIQWAGTLGDTWDLARGGRLTFGTADKK